MQTQTLATQANSYMSNVLFVKCVCASFFTINHTCFDSLYPMQWHSGIKCDLLLGDAVFFSPLAFGLEETCCFLMYNLIWNANKKLFILLWAPHSQRTFAWTRKDRRTVIWDREMTTATHSSIYQSPCISVRNWVIGVFLCMSQPWQDTLY